jgi:hypothetical protein
MLVVGSDKLCLRYDVPQTVRTRHRAWPNRSGTSPCLNKSIKTNCLPVLPALTHSTSSFQITHYPIYTETPTKSTVQLTMSEAPRVEINHTVFPDLDPSAPSNRTSVGSSSEMPQINGTANGSLAQSAQKAGNSILESEVCGTERLRTCRDPANAIHHSLICTSHTTEFPL